MKSGGQIQWNAIAICEMSKTGNLKMNEDLGNPSRTCFVRGVNLRRTSLGSQEQYACSAGTREVSWRRIRTPIGVVTELLDDQCRLE